jgi:hypothetical protein
VKKVIVSPSGIGLNDQSSIMVQFTTRVLVILKPIIDITSTISQPDYIILHWNNNDSSDVTLNVKYDIYIGKPDGTRFIVEDKVSPYTVGGSIIAHNTRYDFVVKKTVTSGQYTSVYAYSDIANISTRRDYRALEEFVEVHGTTDTMDLKDSSLTYDLTYKYFFTQEQHPNFKRFELWYGFTPTPTPPHLSGYYKTVDVESALIDNDFIKHYTNPTWVRYETVTGMPQTNYYGPIFCLRNILEVDGEEFEYVYFTIKTQKIVMVVRLSPNSFSVRQSFVSALEYSYLVKKSDGSEVEYKTVGANWFTVTGLPSDYIPGYSLSVPFTVTFSHEIFDGDRIIIKRTVDRDVYPSDPSSLNWRATWLSNYIEAIALPVTPP